MSAHSDLRHLFRVLARHQDLILDAFLKQDGVLIESAETDKAIDELVRLRLAWRPGGVEDTRLANTVSDLLDSGLRDSRRRTIDADLSSRLDGIEGLAELYKKAWKSSSLADADQYLKSVDQAVYDLVQTLIDVSRRLWRQIDGEFGNVTTLEMKARENQRVLDQAQRLNDGLGMITPGGMEELAGADSRLRRLLGGILLNAVDRCREELTDAMHRLTSMLFKFRRMEAHRRLVGAFYRRYQTDPGFIVANHAESAPIPPLLNQVAPLVTAGHADLADTLQEVALSDIIQGLRKVPPPIEVVEEKRIAVDDIGRDPVEVPVTPLKQAVEVFYDRVMDMDSPLGALASRSLAPDDCDAELWLYAVAARHNAMSREERKLFALRFVETPHATFNGRYNVHDIEVGFRP